MEKDTEIDLVALAALLWSGRAWVAISVLLFSALFVAVAVLSDSVYRASTVLVDASVGRSGASDALGSLGQLGTLAAFAGITIGSGTAQADEAIAVLRSRQFTEAFIRDKDLMPLLFPEQWDPRVKQWKGEKKDWPTLARAYRIFDRDIRIISRDRTTGLITVSVEWTDPVQAAEWANELVERLNEEMRARAIASTQDFVWYLEKELESTATVETRQAIARLMEAQINQRMFANVTQQYAFRIVDRALPPDVQDVVRPKRFLLVMLGPVVGAIFGTVCVACVFLFRRAWKRES